MLDITPPPPPPLTTPLALGLAGVAVVLGGLMLLWGRVLSRTFLGIVGAGVGTLLADSLARQFGLPLVAAAMIAILGLALLAAVAARLIWALAGGAFFGLIAVWVFLSNRLPNLAPTSQPVFDTQTAADWAGWFLACWRVLVAGVNVLWADHSITILWTICLGGGVPLVILLLLPRLGRIFMTGLIGAVSIAGGMLLAVSRFSRAGWPAAWPAYLTYVGIAAAMLTFAIAFQTSGEVAAQRARKKEQDESDDKDSDKKSASKGRKDR